MRIQSYNAYAHVSMYVWEDEDEQKNDSGISR